MSPAGIKTIEALAEDYLDRLRSLDHSPATVKSGRFRLREFVRFLAGLGVETPDRLRRSHLDAWRRSLAARTNREGRPLGAGTVNQSVIRVRELLRFLAERGAVPRSLPETLELSKEPKRLPTSVLTHARTKRLLAKIDASTPVGVRDRALLELAYSSGLRAGEILALDLDDLDLERGTVRVMGKGRKERITPVGKTALRHLESWIRGARPFMVGNHAERAIFLNKDGRRLAYQSLRTMVRKRAADLDDVRVTAHTFRRSCATEMIRGGAALHHVKDILGHETLNTLKHYVKLTVLDLKKTHERCHPREKDR